MTDNASVTYKPRKRFVILTTAWIVLFELFFGAFFFALGVVLGSILYVGTLAATMACAYLWYRNRAYELTETGVKVYAGILAPSQSLLLYGQIQQVDRNQSFVDEILEVVSLRVETMSAASGFSGQLLGLSPQAAQQIQDQIQTRMKQKSPTVKTSKAPDSTAEKATGKPLAAFTVYPIHVVRGFVASGLPAWMGVMAFYGLFFGLTDGPVSGMVNLIVNGILYGGLIAAGLFINLATTSYKMESAWLEIKQSFLGQQAVRLSVDRIQNVIVSQNVFQKFLGIADVKLETGGNPLAATNQQQNQLGSTLPALALDDAQKAKTYFLESVNASDSKTTDLRPVFPLSVTKPLKKTVGAAFWLGLLEMANAVFHLVPFLYSPLGLFFFGALVGGIYLYEKAYFKNYAYRGNEALLTIGKGVFGWNQAHLPYSRIQNLFIDQDWFDRIFGLYDVHVSTIGALSFNEAHIDGVDRATADRLKAELLAKIKENAG